MRVLVACEFSGRVRDAFRKRGHDAWSCDILPSKDPTYHIQGDVLDVIDQGWDLMIAHPPCTHLAISGARHFKKKKRRQKRALDFFLAMLNAPIPKIAVENPVCVASSRIRQPDQITQPWMFGHSAQKTTCLWLKNLPLLKPTNIVDKGKFVTLSSGKVFSEWEYNLSKKSKSKRGSLRSITPKGIAKAMAEQWGDKSYKTGFGLDIKYRILER